MTDRSELKNDGSKRLRRLQTFLWGVLIGVLLYGIASRPDPGGLFDGPPPWSRDAATAK